MNSLHSRLRRYFPEAVKIDAREKARSFVGALLGIFITAVLSQWLIGSDPVLPWLVAPMGASAVLLFAVPASPLAQPWSVLGGNVISALVGVTCAKLIGVPLAAASIAVGAAIAIMFALRCVHPPGGAVALSAALGGPAIAAHGYGFALSPVALNSILLLATAIAYNKLCGRRYPHFATDHANQHRTADARPTERLGVNPEDLDAALAQYNQVLDISRDDLEEILSRTEMHAYQRRFGEVKCGDIMSHDVVKVEFGTELQPAWRLLRQHRIKALPVVNRFNRVIGIVTQYDFIKQSELDEIDGFSDKLRRFLKRTTGTHAEKPEVVGQIMTTAVRTASVNQPIVSLVPMFSDTGLHHLPVVDDNERLVGIVTQSDLVAALYQSRLQQSENQAAGSAAVLRRA
ncbi:HPP family protein [Noviherbaspirillum cavernae]|uniref:HPP family protein n=2 Tax=Noviherbaspirillum cavernae TaxID=2320862 RepID=A0A418WVL9_9BURK|nr:HPP family protein [Noviherbaspirillum cavernae]RJF96730.1 HPP family protein [Noviherbaspirillum cavernae]